MYIFVIVSGYQEEYKETWIKVQNRNLLVKEELIKTFLKAKKLQQTASSKYRDQFYDIVRKHNRLDLLDKPPFSSHTKYSQDLQISPELSNAIDLNKRPSYDWTSYLFQASGGLIELVKPDLEFRFDMDNYDLGYYLEKVN